MKTMDPLSAAREAVAAAPTRPATAVLLDTPHTRLIVFRIAPGQAVPPHQNSSTVLLTVLAGEGVVTGGDGEHHCKAGDLIVFDPGELHGMRAAEHELLLLATIAPRPGAR
jgi:quercetin dioxygenase-like cupin family protein